MTDDWESRIDEFWATADDADEQATVGAMKSLVSERPSGDAAALFELACVNDFVGRESEAIPLYREALDGGLDQQRHPRALIQLASSLRNVGQPDAAIRILEGMDSGGAEGDAAQAFLALALFDAGQADVALRVALTALAKTVPGYGGVISDYADELSRASASD